MKKKAILKITYISGKSSCIRDIYTTKDVQYTSDANIRYFD